MSGTRKFVVSIAGLDPSAGAGLFADLKCFEEHRVYGFGICSALTIQTDNEFLKNEWRDAGQIIAQLEPLLKKFQIEAAKIGLIQDLETLDIVTNYLKDHNPDIKIIVDPILKATAGYKFNGWDVNSPELNNVLKRLNLITPNYTELQSLNRDVDERGFEKKDFRRTDLELGNFGSSDSEHISEQNDFEILLDSIDAHWSKYCPVLLKGGHNPQFPGTDFLLDGKRRHLLEPGAPEVHQKHGSGCVLSAAIISNLAKGFSLLESCRLGKAYIERFLNSNTSLLGYHSS